MGVTLYETDFVLWTEDQAGKLRQARDTGSNLDLDWQHLIDEVEWLGITDRRSLLTDVMCVLEHLTKLEWSPAFDPRRSWADRIDGHRDRIATLLRQSPCLRDALHGALNDGWELTKPRVERDLARSRARLELPLACPYTAAQVLDAGWFPRNRYGFD